MSIEDDDEDSLGAYIKNKNEHNEIDENEIEKDKKEEEEIYQRYEKIGNLTDIKSIKESELTKNYDNEGNKYYNEYKYEKILGKGSYSKVKLVIKDKIKYAMKIIDKKVLKNKKIIKQDKDGNVIITNLLKDALKEIAILKKLDHPNIIKLYEILHNYQKQKIYLILEYAEHGDIVDYDEESGVFSINKHVEERYTQDGLRHNQTKSIDNKKYYDEEDIRHFCKHILLGLDYLHKNGIIHHDIKPNNILLCKNKICKITDFNFSSILDNLNEDNIGTNGDSVDNFRAPETIHLNDDDENENREYQGKPLDIWALGVTIYILTYLKFPFDTDKGVLELYKIIKEAKVEFPLEPWYSRKIKYLIKECLEKNPNERKSAGEILKVLIVHNKDNLDKYTPVFNSKKYTVDLPLQELADSLDFITNLKSAIFENPENKNEKIVLKSEKKLFVYDVPKERSITKIKPNNINVIHKTISISKIDEEKEINKSGNSFTVVVSKKITEIKNDGNKKEIIEKKVYLNNDLIETEEKIEGKTVLKKYIEEK